jgi:hypothetical protein
MRIKIPHLAGSAVPALQSIPKMDSPLFRDRSVTWPQDVNWLRDVFNDIRELWEKAGHDPAADEQLYKATANRMTELAEGLSDVVKQLPWRSDINQQLDLAKSNASNASLHATGSDWAMATTYQAQALIKYRALLDTLTRQASKNIRQYAAFNFTATLTKKGYGYNQEGVIEEPGARNPEHDSGKGNTRNPGLDAHPENHMLDEEAVRDFPELAVVTNHRPTRAF